MKRTGMNGRVVFATEQTGTRIAVHVRDTDNRYDIVNLLANGDPVADGKTLGERIRALIHPDCIHDHVLQNGHRFDSEMKLRPCKKVSGEVLIGFYAALKASAPAPQSP